MNRRARKIISTYAADTSGGPSALYELHGLSVIHDASGCNSTYTTHDEPRWYDMPSSVSITALTEIDAVMGNDGRIVDDILSAMETHVPSFVSITSTPIPYLTGTDLDAIASLIEKRTGIPSWYCPSNGMHPYTDTVASSLINYACRFIPKRTRSERFSINLMAVTPLDFISQKRVESVKGYLEGEGIKINATFAMGDSPQQIQMAGQAHLNLVVSSAGIPVARYFEREYGIPYLVGLPYGKRQSEALVKAIKRGTTEDDIPFQGKRMLVAIGESVQNHSILRNFPQWNHRSITPVGAVFPGDVEMDGEEEIASLLEDADCVIADPLYKPIVPEGCAFIPFPHFAFSGRMFEGDGHDPAYEGLDKYMEVLLK